ncbi:hypothetical protein [Acidithiobacillus thiooxidans]|uniref:hypothetical protein n=1 Tax=Acidithiobacillus thiooxidans TaxID=930 RepID=UPI003566BD85|nr:hypothetical protein [Acidithiobacillus sp.]
MPGKTKDTELPSARKPSARLPSARQTPSARHVPVSVIIGYVLFNGLAYFSDMLNGVPIHLAGLLNRDFSRAAILSGSANAGWGSVAVIAASLTILIPRFWSHRAAFLSFAAPFLVSLAALYQMASTIFQNARIVHAFNKPLAQILIARSFHEISVTYWLLFSISLYLLIRGFWCFAKNSCRGQNRRRA